MHFEERGGDLVDSDAPQSIWTASCTPPPWNLSSDKAGSMSTGRIRREDSFGIFWPIERQGLNDIATIGDFATERTSAYATLFLLDTY